MARVLVTRALPEAEETAQDLRTLGFEPVIAPLRELVPVEGLVPDIAPAALIATSRHAFTFPLPEAAGWNRLPVYVVGERTGDAARAVGFTDIRVGGGDAVTLARRIIAECKAGDGLLYLAGEPRRAELEAALLGAGLVVTTHLCYRMAAVGSLPDAVAKALADGRIDAVLHFSAETAKTFGILTKAAGLGLAVATLRHYCLSASIAAEVRLALPEGSNLGLIVAEEPTARALLAKLRTDFG